MRLRSAFRIAGLVLAACGGDDEPEDATPDPDGGPDTTYVIGQNVFDESVLHEIRIEVDPGDVEMLEANHELRVPCTFTFDGITLHDVAIRQKGQGTSSGSLYTKPSFSVRFDEIERGQKLDGIDKLVLNNSSADPTFLHEAIGNELHHRAGVPAPRTAHAVVTLVGLPGGPRVYGIHVIVEAVNEDFLGRNFGYENADGNLYEGTVGDFVTAPLQTELKNEEDGRSRDHLVELAAIITDTPTEDLATELEPHLDIDRALKTYAIDAIAGNWDGYWFAVHNYYLFDNPGDGRFVIMPHGMDLLLDGCSLLGNASSVLAERILQSPDLYPRLLEAQTAILADVWDPVALQAIVDQFTALLDDSDHHEASFIADRNAHHANRDRLAAVFEATDQSFDAPSECGNGTLERGEICSLQCDDGNLVDGDGCSSTCTPEVLCGDGQVVAPETCDDGNVEGDDGCSATCNVEFCGDGITEPGLGEGCDGENRCREDCSGFIPCGDDVVEWPEYCDDGNHVDGDGCTNECEARCDTVTHGAWTYDFCQAETSYALATGICAHVGGLAVAPRSEEEDDWLKSEAPLHAAGPFWLGFLQVDSEWRGTQGGPPRFDGWASGEPDGDGTCALLDVTGWDDASCDESHPVICRR